MHGNSCSKEIIRIFVWEWVFDKNSTTFAKPLLFFVIAFSGKDTNRERKKRQLSVREWRSRKDCKLLENKRFLEGTWILFVFFSVCFFLFFFNLNLFFVKGRCGFLYESEIFEALKDNHSLTALKISMPIFRCV